MSRLSKESFPATPSYTGSWSAVVMEPVIGCGERITVAVTATGNDEASAVVQAIRPEVLKCIYGDRYIELQNQIQWVVDSIDRYMAVHGTTKGWVAPFSGIYLGEENQAASDNIDGILKQGIRFSASLGTLAMTSEEESVRDYFYLDVRRIVIDFNPEQRPYFGRKVQLTNANHLTQFGYLHDGYAANFGTIDASRTQNDKLANSKILELKALRTRQMLSNLERANPDNLELILRVPPNIMGDLAIPDKTKEKFSERMQNLRYLAERQEVNVVTFDDAANAAEHIIKMAA